MRVSVLSDVGASLQGVSDVKSAGAAQMAGLAFAPHLVLRFFGEEQTAIESR